LVGVRNILLNGGKKFGFAFEGGRIMNIKQKYNDGNKSFQFYLSVKFFTKLISNLRYKTRNTQVHKLRDSYDHSFLVPFQEFSSNSENFSFSS